MKLRKAVLKSFNSGNYTATVQLAGSFKAYLEGIIVARNLASGDPGGKKAERMLTNGPPMPIVSARKTTTALPALSATAGRLKAAPSAGAFSGGWDARDQRLPDIAAMTQNRNGSRREVWAERKSGFPIVA